MNGELTSARTVRSARMCVICCVIASACGRGNRGLDGDKGTRATQHTGSGMKRGGMGTHLARALGDMCFADSLERVDTARVLLPNLRAGISM